MAQQFFGEVTVLDPPVVVGGTAYGLAVRWNCGPGRLSAHGVVSGRLAADPTVVETEYRRIVCAREAQQDSVTITVGPGNVYEMTFPVVMGGNVCQTTEPQRVYSQANARGGRGGDSVDRAQPGDVLWHDGRGFLITACEAFGEAPEAVGWQEGDRLPTVSVLVNDVNELVLSAPTREGANREAEVAFPAGDTGAFWDTGVYVWDGAEYVAAERVTFEGEAEWLPTGAELAGLEYWVDPTTWEVRLGRGTEATGDQVAAVWWWTGLGEATNGAVDHVIEAGAGGGGYLTTEDELASVGCPTLGDVAAVFFVQKGGEGLGYGGGAVEWRTSPAADAAVVAIEWDGGEVVRVWERSTEGGSVGTVGGAVLPASAFTGEFFGLRVRKLGGSVLVQWSADAVTWTTAHTATPAGVEAESAGWLGVATWGGLVSRVQGWVTPATLTVQAWGGASAVLSQRVQQVWEGVAYSKEWVLPAVEAVEGVELEVVDPDGTRRWVAMEEDGGGRDGYGVSGTTVTLWSEGAGDRVRVTQAAAAGEYSGPGRPPRVAGTVGFATMSEVDGVATTDTAENVGNWHDVLVVHDPEGELSAVEGEAFEVRRDAVFSSEDPPVLQFDLRDEEGTESDWSELPAEAFLARWPEGWVLVAEAWLDALPEGSEVCLRATGHGFSQAGNMNARQVNDLASALEAWGDLWIRLETGAAGSGIAGGLPYGGISVGPSATSCYDCSTTYSSAFSWGQARNALATYADNGLPGYYGDSMYYTAFGVVSQYTEANNTQVFSCGTGCVEYTRNELHTTDDHVVGCNPSGGFLGNTTAYQYFGAEWPNWMLGQWSVAPVFHVAGTGLPVPQVVANAPAGTECLAAWARVRFTGLEVWDWTLTVTGDASTYHWVVEVNGVTVQDYVIDRATEAILTDESDVGSLVARTSGGVGFTLMGRRLRSREVTARDTGEVLEIRDDEWVSYPGGIVTGGTASDGEWVLVDVRNVVQAWLAKGRHDQATEFYLWPGASGATPDDGDTGLAAFARTLFPSRSVSTHGTAPNTYAQYSASGSWVTYESLEVDGILARFGLAAGAADVGGLGVLWPGAVAEG